LNAGTSKEYNKSALFSSNGVEKQVISFFLPYSKIDFQLSFDNKSNFLNTSYCVSFLIPSSQYFGAFFVTSFFAVYV